MSKKGLSLVEVMVASLIFALLALSLANLFFSARKFILHSQRRTSAVEILKGFLNQWPRNVREDSPDLCPNVNCAQSADFFDSGGTIYSADCQFSNLTDAELRKANCIISWNETNF